jgi:O-antigen/teichoic acid export membrane protein
VSLKQKAFSAGRWTAASAFLVAGLQLLQTVVLARLLLPAEFGLMAVAASLLAVVALIADLGLSRALIHFDDAPADTLSSLYWLNVGLSLLLMLLLLLLAPVFGNLYGSKALVPVLQYGSLVFPLTAWGQQFRVLAERSLRFSELARIEILAGLAACCFAIVFAFAGGGVYALVAGILVRAAASSALAWTMLSAGSKPSRHLRFAETRPFLRFGGYLVGDSLANNVRRDADVFVGGLVLGPAAMGLYSVPRDLSLRIATVVNPVITRVGFPIMSRLQGDRGKLKEVYLQTLRMTTSVNFPVYVALALFADEIVALLYGPQWQGAGLYLRILAAWGLLRSVGNTAGGLLYAVGRARRAFWWNFGLLLALPPLYWLAVGRWGLEGLAWGVVMLQLAITLPGWRFLVRPACGAGFLEYLQQLIVPLWLSLAAGAVAWAVTHNLGHGTLRLLVGGSVGGVFYLLLSWMFNRRWADAMIGMLRFWALSPATKESKQ